MRMFKTYDADGNFVKTFGTMKEAKKFIKETKGYKVVGEEVLTEIKSKGDLNAQCEIALMGRLVQVTDMPNLIYCMDYLCTTLRNTGVIYEDDNVTGEYIMQKAMEFINPDETAPIGFVVNTIMEELVCVAIVMKDLEKPMHIDSPDGVLCYCYTFNAPDCSELGYCYFEKTKSGIRRIG